jgi:Tol biopolymer transport system component
MLVMPLKPLTVEGELRLNFFGTDDAYGDLDPVLQTDHLLFIPELGVGRISEPKHVGTMVTEFIRANGLLAPQNAGVYGYNFWNDSATSIQRQLVASGKTVNQFTTAHPTIQGADLKPTDPNAWNAQDLIDGVAANTDVLVVMAHGLRASEIAPANYYPTVKPQQLINLANTTPAIKRLKLLVTGACNFALAIPAGQGITNVTPDPRTSEIPQALGWTAVAWDSYAYGDDERIAYSEELADDLFTELRYGGSDDVVVLGDAIARVKRDWAARQTDIKGIQQKSLMGMGILGFPMLRVNMGSVGRLGERPKGLADFTSLNLTPVPAGTPGSDAALNLRTKSGDITINFDAAGHQLVRKNLSLTNIGTAGSTTASYYQVQTSDTPPRSFVQMNPLEPIAPRWSIPLHPSDLLDSDPTFARGAVLMSATCLDEPSFVPLISAPAYQLTPPRGPYLADRFEPNDWWKVNYLNTGREFLLLRPGLFRSTRSATGAPENFGTERTFHQATFRAYYSWLVGATVTDGSGNTMQAIQAGPPEFLSHSATPNGAGTAIDFETIASGLPNVGIQSVFVTWWDEAATCGTGGSGLNSLELTQSGTNAQQWSRSLALPSGVSASNVRYLLQAVNGAGRVRVADNFGLGFPAETPPTAPAPTADTDLAFTLVGAAIPPTTATVASGRKITVAAKLTRPDTNADLAGKRLIFRLSGVNGDRAFAYTGTDGVATANLKVDTLPGSFFVHVEFEGDDDLAGSSDRSPQLTVTRETTAFSRLSPLPTTQQQGATIQVSALLSDGLARPLREQDVMFLITAPDCTAYPNDASSCTVLQAQGAETDYAGRARAGIALRGAVGTSYRVHVAFAGKVKVPTGDPLPPFDTVLNLRNARYEPARASLGVITVTNEKIAFTSNRTGNGDIYVMNVDGSGVTQLTNGPAIDADPDWSPDRTKIAFTSNRTGNGDVYVMNADGTGVTQLTTSNAVDTLGSWSPDGTRIAFTSTRDGNPEIYVMNADGSGQTRLTNNPRIDADPFWSPDGTKIAFSTTRDGNSEVYVMNANGSNPTRLTNNAAVDTLGAWSPDGSKIVFSSTRTGNGDIYVMNADGTGVTQLTTSPGIDASPDWSPDGTRIVFASNRDGNWEIYTMDANGLNQTRRTNNAAFDGLPSW